MKRHTLLSTLWLAFGLVRLPLTADAQQATKLHCLGWLAIVRRWRTDPRKRRHVLVAESRFEGWPVAHHRLF